MEKAEKEVRHRKKLLESAQKALDAAEKQLRILLDKEEAPQRPGLIRRRSSRSQGVYAKESHSRHFPADQRQRSPPTVPTGSLLPDSSNLPQPDQQVPTGSLLPDSSNLPQPDQIQRTASMPAHCTSISFVDDAEDSRPSLADKQVRQELESKSRGTSTGHGAGVTPDTTRLAAAKGVLQACQSSQDVSIFDLNGKEQDGDKGTSMFDSLTAGLFGKSPLPPPSSNGEKIDELPVTALRSLDA